MIRVLLAATAALGLASAANATQYFNFDGQMGAFGDLNVASPTFDETFTLSLTTPGLLTLSVLSNGAGDTNIDFSNVTFDGVAFTSQSSGTFEYQTYAANTGAGDHTITVSGLSGDNAGYSGIISLTPSAVPEAASWAMLVAGFGLMGGALRRRRTYSLAQAV